MAMIWSREYSSKNKKINLIFVKTYWCPTGFQHWVSSKEASISNVEEARLVLRPPSNNHTVFDGSAYFLIFYELCRIICGSLYHDGLGLWIQWINTTFWYSNLSITEWVNTAEWILTLETESSRVQKSTWLPRIILLWFKQYQYPEGFPQT